jgi:hypothetical protein
MNRILEPLCIVTLAVLATGCSSGVDVSWSTDNSSGSRNNGVSISRNNEELTVKMGDEPVIEGSGNLATEKRDLTAFNKLAAHHGIQVQIEEGVGDSLRVETDDNLLPLVETKIDNETLHVQVKGSLKTRKPIRVTVSAKQLSDISASSSARITGAQANDRNVYFRADSSGEVVIDEARGDRVDLAASSSGGVTAKSVACKKLSVMANSSGRVAASGNADEQQVDVSSSGMYNGGDLTTRQTNINCNSAGSATVQVTHELSGSASSAGSVLYSGNPAKMSVRTDSAGSVVKAE